PAPAAVSRLRRTLDQLQSAASVDGWQVSFSAGVVAVRPGTDVEGLMERADAALYTAKREGGARIREYA
ncbi:MAG: diguanylate cyclase, partial [Candidatus Dormibacteraeota bacterium]|nr:diguanylate cyclase [Candidatus Dormibacteraeota bacterium]